MSGKKCSNYSKSSQGCLGEDRSRRCNQEGGCYKSYCVVCIDDNHRLLQRAEIIKAVAQYSASAAVVSAARAEVAAKAKAAKAKIDGDAKAARALLLQQQGGRGGRGGKGGKGGRAGRGGRGGRAGGGQVATPAEIASGLVSLTPILMSNLEVPEVAVVLEEDETMMAELAAVPEQQPEMPEQEPAMPQQQERVVTVEFKGSDFTKEVSERWGSSTMIVDVSAGGIKKVLEQAKGYAQLLDNALHVRMEQSEVLAAMTVIEPEIYRRGDAVGDSDVPTDEYTKRFEVLKGFYGVARTYTCHKDGTVKTAAPLIDLAGVKGEEAAFFDFMQEKAYEKDANNGLLGMHAIWASYRSTIKEDFPCISTIFEISLVLPLSNAIVERMFSSMNICHTEVRNSMHVPTVDAILTIQFEGPDNHEVGLPNCKEIYNEWSQLRDGNKYGHGAHGEWC
jgi:hypothetical protein